MVFGSVCSGIEAASAAWEPLGWEAAFVSEIAAFPSAVLAHHYPRVPNHGDLNGFGSWPRATLDVLIGGTPCQSFSVAGLRAGMADPRGNLALTYLACVDRYRPEWVVWENVPGVLSSWSDDPDSEPRYRGESGWFDYDQTNDFDCFLRGLSELRYGWAYRVLDAQFFGVPQRRRRVFVVGCARGWRHSAAVLFDRASLRGDPAPCRKTREGTAGTLGAGAGRRSAPDVDRDQLVAGTLSSRPSKGGGLGTDFEIAGGLQVAGTLNHNHGQPQTHHAWTNQLVAGTLRGNSHDASEDGSGRGTPLVALAYGGNNSSGAIDVATARAASRSPSGRLDFASETFVVGTLQAKGKSAGSAVQQDADQGHLLVVPFDTTQITSKTNRSNPQVGAPALARGSHPPAIAFQSKQSSTSHGPSFDECAPTLDRVKARGMAVAFNARQDPDSGAVTHPLDTDGSSIGIGIGIGGAVRRLTPRECERLQGFPDDYTLIPYRGLPAKDGPRYEALGNSMAVPVIRWLGERIELVNGLTRKTNGT